MTNNTQDKKVANVALTEAYADASYEVRVEHEDTQETAEKYGLDITKLEERIAYDYDMLEAEGLYYDHL